jgi:ABC-2 type transport system ATP-binding protein
MKGELLLVEAAPLGPALEAVKGAPGVLDAAVFGNALHVLAREAQSATRELREGLEKRGITVNKIEAIRPSLEDVFVALTTERAAPRKERAG